jgi:Fe-S-cluster containining protein
MVGQHYGLGMTNTEKNRLVWLAERHAVRLTLKPLARSFGAVTLWQFAENPCPFLDARNRCTIYNDRPLYCRTYPVHPGGLGECRGIRMMIGEKRGYVFPQYLIDAGNQFSRVIMPKIRTADALYNLDKGWIPNPYNPQAKVPHSTYVGGRRVA